MPKKVEKKLQNYLILNRYLLSLFGFKSFRDVQNTLRSKQEGLSPNKKFFFTEALQTKKISDSFRQDLEKYDEQIQQYVIYINQKRLYSVQLKYYQYFGVLLTEIYLDNYYNHLETFYIEFVKFIMKCNKKEKRNEKNSYPYPNKKEMRKLAIWAATGTGKTLIMHINMLQIMKYFKGKFNNYLLISPNEGLSKQHINEMNLSNIKNIIFDQGTMLESWMGHNPIQVIEITKFKEDKDITSREGKSVAIEAFGNRNIIFVDEGHKGQVSSDANVWMGHRKDLVKKGGFTFEYSATFGEITDQDDVFNEYASSIIMDYTYKYFYEDGYGKDYSILNLRNPEDYGKKYLTFALLSFYEQKKYYEIHTDQLDPFNIANPLMVFVGTYVSGRGKKENDTDIQTVCKFLAEFVNKKSHFCDIIEKILTDKSGLLDNKGNLLTNEKLLFLKDYINNHKLNSQDLFNQILKDIFYIDSPAKLEFIELSKADGEIGIKFGSKFCALVNIGEPSSFLKVISKDIDKKPPYEYYKIGPKAKFQNSLFDVIDEADSKINFLIGSKKFIEGWNSYRVSSMCLLNIGKKKGALVIQLFGRGVRLRGYKGFLKRSTALAKDETINIDEISIPANINLVETLNIFGIKAEYIEDFRENLKESGIEEHENILRKIKTNFPSSALYLSHLVKKTFSFVNEVSIIGLNQNIPKTVVDLSSKVELLESNSRLITVNSSDIIKERYLDSDIIELLDINQIYMELMRYKELKGYTNLYFTKKDILQILANKDKEIYSFNSEESLLTIQQTDEIIKLNRIQGYIIQMLKKILDKSYRHEKSTWQKKKPYL